MSQQVGPYEFRPWGDVSERGGNHSAVYLVPPNGRKARKFRGLKSSSSRQVTEEGRDGCGSTID